MQEFRCSLCGEVTVATQKPSDCAFCAAKNRYMKLSGEVNGDTIFSVPNLSDDSRKNLLVALNQETGNASFYKCVSNTSDSERVRALFKRLARLTREHADIMRKYLELDPIEYMEEECSVEDDLNLVAAQSRIAQAIEFYKIAHTQVREFKVSDLFKALLEIEQGFEKLMLGLQGK
ncbi:MAG: ferritin family protein [Patescibacteria group bacterium]